MIALFVPSASDDDAVTPTVAALAAFSATVLVPESESVGAVASDSSTSVRVTVNVSSAVLESALVAVISNVHVVPAS